MHFHRNLLAVTVLSSLLLLAPRICFGGFEIPADQWMSYSLKPLPLGNEDTMADRYLYEIAIPGTHDSATVDINPQSPLGNDGTGETMKSAFEKVYKAIDGFDPLHIFKAETKLIKKVVDGLRGEVMSNWARTQDVSVLGQAFNKGVRYFDLRLTLDWSRPLPSDYPFYIVHGLITDSAEKYMHTFADLFHSGDTPSKEILLLDFNHVGNMTAADDEVFLKQIIKPLLGQRLIPRNDDAGRDVLTHYTYREITEQFPGKNIIVLYRDNSQGAVVEKHPEIWYSDYFGRHSDPNKHTAGDRSQLISYWPNSRSYDATLSGNQNNINLTFESNQNVLRVNQFQETPAQKQIQDGIATMVDQALGDLAADSDFSKARLETAPAGEQPFYDPWTLILEGHERPEKYVDSPNNIFQTVWRKVCKFAGFNAKFYRSLLEWERSLNQMKLNLSCFTVREATRLYIGPDFETGQFPFGNYLNIVIVDDAANFSYNKDSACYRSDYAQWKNVYDQIETTTYLQMFLVLNGMPYPVKEP